MIREGQTIYRAANDEPTAQPWTCWSRDRETAEAYTVAGVGHGGSRVWAVQADLSHILDIHTSDALSDFATLASALGYDDEMAQEWRDNGWLYPWEESQEIRERLASSGYRWLAYTDDYPAGAETLMAIRV